MARHSYKKHGHWVVHKELRWEGKIAYYDRKTKLVWVLWDPQFTPKKWKKAFKGYASSGHPVSELATLPYEPDPWFNEEVKMS